MLVGAGGGLPDRALVDLAVAHQHEDLAVAAGHAGGERHAERRSTGRGRARRCRPRRRAPPVSGWPPRNESKWQKRSSSPSVEEALVRQHGIERQAAVPLAQDEAVALGPVRLGRVVAQEVVVEDADDLDQGKRRPDMPAPAVLDGAKDEAPQVPAPIVQRRLLNQVEVGRILQRSLMLHASRLLSDRPSSAIFKLARVPMAWESAFGRRARGRDRRDAGRLGNVGYRSVPGQGRASDIPNWSLPSPLRLADCASLR